MFDPIRPCSCNSGESSWWLKDARGIECCRVCDKCIEEKKARYCPEIFSIAEYDDVVEDRIDPEDM